MKKTVKQTPWGPAQTADEIAPGIIFYSTASHGGYHLSLWRNADVPLAVRKKTFCKLGMKGWYEEDCDARIVESVFSECFAPARRVFLYPLPPDISGAAKHPHPHSQAAGVIDACELGQIQGADETWTGF